MANIDIEALTPAHAAAVSALADRLIGPGYYPLAAAEENLARGVMGDFALCFGAYEGADLVGFRITAPPGAFDVHRGAHPDRWGVDTRAVAYFKSAFVAPSHAGRGIGSRLATASLSELRRAGVGGVLAHSWKESPGNSSAKYLEKLGFVAIAEHPSFWSDVDYVCVRDGFPCQCTAVEMFLRLAEPSRSPGGA
jgi:hypothetical protein